MIHICEIQMQNDHYKTKVQYLQFSILPKCSGTETNLPVSDENVANKPA